MEEQGETKKKQSRVTFVKPTRRQLYVVITILVVLLLVATGILIYKKGESNGKKMALKSPFNFNTSLADRLKNGNNALPIQTVSGNVVQASEGTITVEMQNKEQKQFRIDDQTRITLKGEDKEATDIENGSRVTVFARKGNKESPLATRIVIRQSSEPN